jgi:hydrogenase-4 component B
VLMIGLLLVGLSASLCALLFPLHRRLSHGLTLLFSILITVVAVWGLWHPSSSSLLNGVYLSLNPLRSWFLLLLGVVSIASSWYRIGYREHNGRIISFWLPLFLMSMVAVISSNNLWVFMTAWELMSITSFFLVIADHHRPGVLESGYVYLVMSQLSAVTILSGLLLMSASMHSVQFANWPSLAPTLKVGTKNWIFGLLAFGFSVKSGIIPFHIWLPRAHPVAPTPVSSLMSGVMIKLGIFGIAQFLLLDLGPISVVWPIVLLATGAASTLLGVLYALMERDLKRLLAYSSIENVGIIFIGLGVMALGMHLHQSTIETLGLTAALLHSLNHAIFKSQLFLAAGAVHQHTGTLDAEHLGGLMRTIPGVAMGFVFGSMAISAIPPLNGFLSEWLTFRGLLSLMNSSTREWTVFGLVVILMLAMASALAGMAFVKAFGIIFLGQARSHVRHEPIPRSMTWPILMLSGFDVLLGVFPTPIVRVISDLQPGLALPTPARFIPTHTALLPFLLFALVMTLVMVSRPWDVQVVPRWSCGRVPDASMQFTSASFTKAVRTTLAWIYRPHRKVTRVGTYATDFPERLIYEAGTSPVWERYIYRPGYRLVWWLSHHSTRLQAGPVRLYLTYLLATIAVMFLLLR